MFESGTSLPRLLMQRILYLTEQRPDDNELEQRAGGFISKRQLSEAKKGWVGDKGGRSGRDTRDAWTNQAGVLVRE